MNNGKPLWVTEHVLAACEQPTIALPGARLQGRRGRPAQSPTIAVIERSLHARTGVGAFDHDRGARTVAGQHANDGVVAQRHQHPFFVSSKVTGIETYSPLFGTERTTLVSLEAALGPSQVLFLDDPDDHHSKHRQARAPIDGPFVNEASQVGWNRKPKVFRPTFVESDTPYRETRTPTVSPDTTGTVCLVMGRERVLSSAASSSIEPFMETMRSTARYQCCVMPLVWGFEQKHAARFQNPVYFSEHGCRVREVLQNIVRYDAVERVVGPGYPFCRRDPTIMKKPISGNPWIRIDSAYELRVILEVHVVLNSCTGSDIQEHM